MTTYWKRRQQQLNNQMEKDEIKLKRRLSSFYDTEYRKLEKEIAAFYQQYGKDNIIEYRNLMERLSDVDRKLLLEKMGKFADKYPEYEHLLPVRESIYKLNRLEGLQTSIRMQQLEIGAVNQQALEKHLQTQAARGANAAAETLGFGKNFYAVNSDIVKMIVNKPWAEGKNFSQRIWKNTEKLANYLNTDAAQALARGDTYERIMRQLSRRFENVSRNDMYRLIYSEGTFVMAESTMQPFLEDFQKYRISIADLNACPICKGLAEMVFFIKDRQAGINFPALHAWCRCTFEIVVENWYAWMEDYEQRHGNGQAEKVANRLNDGSRGDTIQVADPAAGFRKKSRAYTIEEDLRAVNPKHQTEKPEWTLNCQRCVSAYEARRRGYDVTAKPRVLDGTDTLPIMKNENGWPSVYKDFDLIACPSNSGKNAGKKVKKLMDAWGDGARAIVRVRWKGGGGHVFIAERNNGNVTFIDPQTGNMNTEFYFEHAKKDDTYVMRIDNLEFTDRIIDCCE